MLLFIIILNHGILGKNYRVFFFHSTKRLPFKWFSQDPVLYERQKQTKTTRKVVKIIYIISVELVNNGRRRKENDSN